jgi:hypothetical protein
VEVGDLIQRKFDDDHYWRHMHGLDDSVMEPRLFGIIVEIWTGAYDLRKAKICWNWYGVSWHPIDRLEIVNESR